VEIQNLSVSERIMLAEALWDSVAKHDAEIELTEKQKLELDKRIANYEVDCDTGSSWSEVRERIIAKK
jgi:putative addiction module component (TIGR02574 family)